jgi:hypothetical protein
MTPGELQTGMDMGIDQDTDPREIILVAAALVASASVGVVAAGAALSDGIVLGLVLALLAVLTEVGGVGRAVVVVGAIAYVGLLQVTYVDLVVPLYAYTGLTDSGAASADLLLVTALAVVPALWLPTVAEQPSDVLIWFLYLFGYVPAVVIPIYVIGPDLGRVLPLILAIAVGFAIIGLMRRLPRAALRWPGMRQRRFENLLLILGVISLAYLVLFFGIPTQIPDFASVYDLRAQFAATPSPGAGYVVAWAGNVIYPILIAMGLSGSRRIALVLGIAGQLLIYSLDGAKAILFTLVLIPVVLAVLRWGPRLLGPLLAFGSVLLVAVAVVATNVSGNAWPLAIVVVRLMALPGQLTAYYFDFFSTHATYLLSHSILKAFTDAPYTSDPPTLIGGVYLHAIVDANANIWADGMANFGLPGVIGSSFILGALLWIVDSVAWERSLLLVGPTLAIAALTLSDGALLTAILTNGIGLAIALFALMPTRTTTNLASLGAGP